MARIRTIKPEFFTSEDIVSLTPLARLFYVSLWCEADREGRLEWKPRTLKLRYLPADDCSIEALGQELIDEGLIVLYEVDGKTYAEIPGFKKHQVINNRESASTIPPRCDDENDASTTRESGVKAEGKGREGKGKERKGKERDSGVPPSASRSVSTKPRAPAKTPLPPDFAISEGVRAWAEREGHADNLQAHFDHFVGTAIARGYTYANWDQALMNAIRADWARVRERRRPTSATDRTLAEIDDFVNGPGDDNVIEMEARRVGD